MYVNQQITVSEELITQRHNIDEQSLYLRRLSNCWKDCLSYRNWQHLKIIYMEQCQIQDMDVKVLNNYSWPHLEQLGLFQNNIGNEGVKALLRGHWPSVKRLWLNSNPIDTEGMEKLLVCDQQFPILQELSLAYCKIKWIRSAKIPERSTSKHLKSLILNKNQLRSHGCQILAKINFEQLQQIRIGQCNINNCGFKHLCKGKWPKLKTLDVDANNLGCDAYECLSNINLTLVKLLHFARNQLTISMFSFAVMDASPSIFISNLFSLNFDINNDMQGVFVKRCWM